ncbi:MAG: TIGR01777 family oxidoreductase [Gemmatimonadaceae bacterium]
MPSDPTSQSPITVAVSGATGMIGSALVSRLREQGHTVRRLVRSQGAGEPEDIHWHPSANELDARVLEGVDAIVHLAGEPIAQRWTSRAKHDIRASRIQGTSLIASAVTQMQRKPQVVVSGSAIGIYGDRGDELLDESSAPGTDFLAGIGREWESSAAPVASAGVRLVLIRSGIVLSADGGALGKMLPPFRLGAGGPMGSGRQWMSWITLADHLRAIEHSILTPSLRGPVNLVAPNPVRNADFAHALGHALGRPAIIPLPAFALELMFGEMAKATILAGQRVAPGALGASGFTFAHPTLPEALEAVLR